MHAITITMNCFYGLVPIQIFIDIDGTVLAKRHYLEGKTVLYLIRLPICFLCFLITFRGLREVHANPSMHLEGNMWNI